MIDTEFYKKDYEESTKKLLAKLITYSEVIKMIIESGVLERDN